MLLLSRAIFNSRTIQFTFLFIGLNLITAHKNSKASNTDDNRTQIGTNKLTQIPRPSEQDNDLWKRAATSHTIASRAKITELAKLKQIIHEQQKIINSLSEQRADNEKLEKENQSLVEELKKVRSKNETEGDEDSRYVRLTYSIPLPVNSEFMDYSLKELTPEMPEHSIVTAYITNSNYATDKLCRYDVEVHKIYAVHYKNNTPVRLPIHKEDGKVNRHLLFHGTKMENVPGILQSGFSIDPERVTNASDFGVGIYFADRVCHAAHYSHYYSEDDTLSSNGVILLNEVALGKQFTHNRKVFNNYDDITPEKLPENADSVIVRGQDIPDPNDQKSLDDGIIVPSGKTVKSEPNSKLRRSPVYNAYVVYSGSQVKVRFLISAKITPKYSQS